LRRELWLHQSAAHGLQRAASPAILEFGCAVLSAGKAGVKGGFLAALLTVLGAVEHVYGAPALAIGILAALQWLLLLGRVAFV